MQFHTAKWFRVSVRNIISVSFMHMTPAFWRAYNRVTDFSETQGFRLTILRNCHSRPSTMHSPSDGVTWIRETAPLGCAKQSQIAHPLTALPSSLTANFTH